MNHLIALFYTQLDYYDKNIQGVQQNKVVNAF